MGFSEKPAVWTDREPTLDEENGALDEEDIFEMANLTEDQTGIAGIVFISTVMGAHGPQVKYFLQTGPGQPSFSVSVASEPRVVASSLPDRDFARMAPPSSTSSQASRPIANPDCACWRPRTWIW